MATTGGHVELALRLISGGADLQLAAVLDGHPDPLTPLEHAKRLGQLQIAAAIESAVLPRLEDLVASAKVTGDTAKIDDLDRSIGLAVAAIGTPETDPILIEARLTLSELRLGKVRSLLQSSAIVFVVVLAGACFAPRPTRQLTTPSADMVARFFDAASDFVNFFSTVMPKEPKNVSAWSTLGKGMLIGSIFDGVSASVGLGVVVAPPANPTPRPV